MYGPNDLKHFLYVAIPIIFLLVIAYMVYYNRRVRNRQQQLNHGGEVHNTPSSIAAATDSLHHDHDKK